MFLGNNDVERRAFSWCAAAIDLPAQRLGDDVMDDVQTETAAVFGGKEGVEDFIQTVRIDALAVVGVA